ncbi:MAG: DEAD/DEAH box helicase [Verrucomicrobiae bacterium]|nr:DEAD/DEAH box helicase [Verrucomicrobiae bacterium]
MIPSVIARQVRQGIADFLRTTYPPAEPFFEGVVERLLADPEAVFKGPYITLKLPFRPGNHSADYFNDIPLQFPPYRHQELAFERLGGASPQSTLIATGTGSGKTECFLYPILDYCYQYREKRGIKAIIIYPMNALATDQARRFAREIAGNPKLKGNVTAGLFIGGQDSDEGIKIMQDDMVITCKNTMRKYPPDILMTNYKMLDYMLLRPQDYSLWQDNDPATLRYVVVDELHTFDGAQGTDLACLLRRLLSRLKTPTEQVCFVGTSATLGDEQGPASLLDFAGNLFGQDLSAEAVIKEDVLRPGEFLGDDTLILYHQVPGADDVDKMLAAGFTSPVEYVTAQCALWFDGWTPKDASDHGFGLELGQKLREHQFFQNFIRILNGPTIAEVDVRTRLERVLPGFSMQSIQYQTALVDSLMGLISNARMTVLKADGERVEQPFLQLRLQLWLRELRRMVVSVGPEPRIRFAADLRAEEPLKHLPLIHCRSCERMGWVSTKGMTDNRFSADLDKIYSAFFAHSPTLQFIFHEDRAHLPPGQMDIGKVLCGRCLNLTHGEHIEKCANCGADDALVSVRDYNVRTKDKNGRVHVYSNCPHCGAYESLTIFGSRSASLISVAISQLMASIYNDDRKLLAFSDSVQDASHRAGFFGARTYRFNIRMAIQQVLRAQDEDTVITLDALPELFMAYWMERLGSPEAFVAEFIAPDMQWMEEYAEFEDSGRLAEDGGLLELIRKRIHWDVLSEYGHRARIGRTLEKTGCSIIRLNAEVFTKWADFVHRELREHIGGLREIDKRPVKQLLAGIVRQCRTRGGIWGAELVTYMQSGGNAYLLSSKQLPFMPRDLSVRRAPAFIFDGNGSLARFDTLLGSGTSLTSYQKWLIRCLGDVTAYSQDSYRMLMKQAVELGIFKEEACSAGRVYGLNPAFLEVECAVDQYVCSRTRHAVSAPASERTLWEGMPSTRYDAPEAVMTRLPERDDYYGHLFQHGHVYRAIPKEHTGLLERQARERLEERFIAGHGAPEPNILSCTPTLEMGINIGELSTVILCSVPPTQANYIQRTGRAGRRDGNAFNMVVATGKPHDLHFYADPVQMMAGAVVPPGVFLNAPAVLERQLTAYCFDEWIKAVDGKATVIPHLMNAVLNQMDQKVEDGKFPYNLLKFIDLKRTALLQGFLALFREVLTDASVEHLDRFICGGAKAEGSLDCKIINRLTDVLKERDELRQRLRRIRERIKKNRAMPARDPQIEQELEDLQYEKSALNRIVRAINSRQTYNFFTDEGLLPNYAFPEAGISLRSVIYRKKNRKEEGKGNYEVWTNEYERPAGAAILELAPGNAFYVDGRKLVIDQIDMSVSPTDRWRFCGNCSHAEMEAQVTQKGSCPKCGSATWGDAAMVRNLVRMKQVVATQSDRDSRSYDDSDERQPVFFNKYMLTDVDKTFIEKAFQLKDKRTPFGFEFLRKATFREINFGKKDFFEDDEIAVAGKKVSRQGFRICESCGKVKPEEDKKPFKHAIDCKYYGKSLEKGMVECLYLYREFESEAIRMLLPVGELDMEGKLSSFIAALYMALSRKFKGNVQHLQTLIMEEPVPGADLMKKYLVLYDQIPGGTGYLKELMRSPSDIMALLTLAFDGLRTCSCAADEDKDGCYKCLYAYRVSRDLPTISRAAAISMLEEILVQKDQIEEVSSVEDISVNALFESELEARFIEALRRSKVSGRPIDLRSQMVRGKSGYFMQVNGNSYEIEPQVNVGPEQGVDVPSRVDFMIYPMRQSQGDARPIAVFTDGFTFHGEPDSPNYRVHRDLEQRMALVRSGKYRCWSVTYDDVMSLFDITRPDYWDQFHPEGMDKLLSAYQAEHTLRPIRAVVEKDAMSGLVLLLGYPDWDAWQTLAFIYGLSFLAFGLSDETIVRAVKGRLLDYVDSCHDVADQLRETSGTYFWGFQQLQDQGDQVRSSAFSQGVADAIRSTDKNALHILLRFEDLDVTVPVQIFKRSWNGLLQSCNILQFLPHAVVLTTRYLAEGLSVPEYKRTVPVGKPDVTKVDVADLQEIRDLAQEDVLYLVEWINELEIELPEVGYELVDGNNQVIAEAELAWEHLKIAILIDETGKALFEDAGWAVSFVAELSELSDFNRLFERQYHE